jgi:hypothetical protein
LSVFRWTKVLPQFVEVGSKPTRSAARRRWIEPVEIASTY